MFGLSLDFLKVDKNRATDHVELAGFQVLHRHARRRMVDESGAGYNVTFPDAVTSGGLLRSIAERPGAIGDGGVRASTLST